MATSVRKWLGKPRADLATRITAAGRFQGGRSIPVVVQPVVVPRHFRRGDFAGSQATVPWPRLATVRLLSTATVRIQGEHPSGQAMLAWAVTLLGFSRDCALSQAGLHGPPNGPRNGWLRFVPPGAMNLGSGRHAVHETGCRTRSPHQFRRTDDEAEDPRGVCAD